MRWGSPIVAGLLSVVPAAGCAQTYEPTQASDEKYEAASEPSPPRASTTPAPPPLEQQLRTAAQGYYDAVIQTYRTYDEKILWKRASMGACTACEKHIQAIRSDKSKGLRFESERWIVSGLEITRKDNGAPEATFTLADGGGQVVNAKSGAVVERVEPNRAKHRMVFGKGREGWTVIDDFIAR